MELAAIVDDFAAHRPLPLPDKDPSAESAENAAPVPPNHPANHGQKATDRDWAEENIKRRKEMSDFWITKPLGRLNIIRRYYAALRELMQFKLETGGKRWELRQRAKVAKAAQQGLPTEHVREYRVLLVATNVAEDKCMRAISHLLTSEMPWGVIMQPTDMVTVAGRALAFRIGSRAGACVEELRRKHVQFPFRTFLMFRSPETAGDIVREVAQHQGCKGSIIDEWTLDLVRRFGTADALRGPVPRSIILLRMMMIYIENGCIESLHAWVRRVIVLLSTQTHPSSFVDVNSFWMFGRHRNLVVLGKFDGLRPNSCALTSSSAGRKGRTKRLGILSVGGAIKNAKHKSKKGGGGAWRAFLRQSLWKCSVRRPFKGRMQALRQAYFELPPAAMAKLRSVGEAATRSHRAGHCLFDSSFGDRSRTIERARKKALEEALMNRCLAVEDELDEVAVVQDISLGQTMESLKAVRSASRVRAAVRIANLRRDFEYIEQFMSGEGARALTSWNTTRLASFFSGVNAVPTEGSTVFELTHSSPKEKDDGTLEGLISYLSDNAETSHIRQQLEQTWEQLNQAILEKDVEGCFPDVQSVNQSCREAGVCLCTASGRRLSTLRESLLTHCIKKNAQPHSPCREDLKSGKWMVQLQGFGAHDYPISDAPAAEAPAEYLRAELFLHLALQVLSPWRSTYQLLERTSPPRGEPAEHGLRMYTKTSVVFEADLPV